MTQAPTFKANPIVGESYDTWLDRCYADGVRGPDNKIVHNGVAYASLTDAELATATERGRFAEVVWNSLRAYMDPTMLVAPKAGRHIIQVSVSNTVALGPDARNARIRCSAPRVRDILNVWRWSGEAQGPVLLDKAEREAFLSPEAALSPAL